jgi:hypothetical protein
VLGSSSYAGSSTGWAETARDCAGTTSLGASTLGASASMGLVSVLITSAGSGAFFSSGFNSFGYSVIFGNIVSLNCPISSITEVIT